MHAETLPAAATLAAERIAPWVRETPLIHSTYLSAATGADVWLKLENLQLTGSFKLRGAFNKLLTLEDAAKRAGCVAASSGNHGAAVAYAMHALSVSGPVFVPEGASTSKVDAIRRYGGDVRFFGHDGLDTEQHARAYASEHGMTYLSPYNDEVVVAGQATCGVEIANQLDAPPDAVFVAVGGGGLIAGVGGYLKSRFPEVEIVGCQPAASAVMKASVEAGEIVDLPSEPTLSDGTAGGIEAGAVTFELCRKFVDRFVTVEEDQIAAAMQRFIDAEHQLLEGAAGVALAAFEQARVESMCQGCISL